jgi:hypothetical protein
MYIFLDVLVVTQVLIKQLHNKVKVLGIKVQTEIISALKYNNKVLYPCHEGIQEKQMCSSTNSYPSHYGG